MTTRAELKHHSVTNIITDVTYSDTDTKSAPIQEMVDATQVKTSTYHETRTIEPTFWQTALSPVLSPAVLAIYRKILRLTRTRSKEAADRHEQYRNLDDPFLRDVYFLMRVLSGKKTNQERLAVIFDHIKTLASEYLLQPIHTRGQEVAILANDQTSPTDPTATAASPPTIEIYWPGYGDKNDVLSIAQHGSIVGGKEGRRYQLEATQLAKIYEILASLIADMQRATNSPEKPSAATLNEPISATTLTNFGFQKIEQSSAQQQTIIPLGIMSELDLSAGEELWVGPTLYYSRPASEVHVGNASILNLERLVYIPSQQRFVLIHHQFCLKMDFTAHLAQINAIRATLQLPPISANTTLSAGQANQPEKIMEEAIMGQVLALPAAYQLLPAQDCFKKLTSKVNISTTSKQWLVEKIIIPSMEGSFNNMADLVLEVLEIELTNAQLSWSDLVTYPAAIDLVTPHQAAKLKAFWKRVILACACNLELFSAKKRRLSLAHYQQNPFISEEQFAKGQRQITKSPQLALDFAALPCIAGGLNSITQMNKANPASFLATTKENHCNRCPNCDFDVSGEKNKNVCPNCGFGRDGKIHPLAKTAITNPDQEINPDGEQATPKNQKETIIYTTTSVGADAFFTGVTPYAILTSYNTDSTDPPQYSPPDATETNP